MDYIQKMLINFAWKLDEYYSGDEHPEHIEKLVEDFLTEYKPYDQPERSKREDSINIPPGTLKFVEVNGELVVRRVYNGKIIPMTWKEYKERCGALNS